MAAEQAIVGISMLAVAFLWYSNELRKGGDALWSQAFQTIAFLFMLVDFTVMVQMFRAEALFDMEDLVFISLFNIIWWVMFVLLGLWFFTLVVNMMKTLRNPDKLESIKHVGRNQYGPGER